MVIFYCPQHPNYSLWAGTRFLEFKRGVLSTDEKGAAYVRKHPMYGRLFSDVPPDPVIDPHPELRLADLMVLPTETYDCPECDETLPSRMALQMHYDQKHPETEVNGNGERQGAIGQDEISGEGEGERDTGRSGPRR
jgi:hypothetical protein